MADTDEMDGSPQRVNELIDSHFDFVWRQLRRQGLSPADADDAAQEVFMIAARKITRIDPDKTRSFLYGATIRVARNVRRGLRRKRAVSEALEPAVDSQRGPEATLEAHQARALLDALLNQLPDELRRVLVLSHIEELSAPAVAELEGIPIGTVASRLRRARAEFKRLLAERTADEPFRGEHES